MVEGYWGHERYSDGVEIRGTLDEAPEGLGIDVHDSNVNEDQMYWGEAYETGEQVIVKDGSAEFGNAAPANLLAYELFSDTEINVPDVGYSAERDEIYMEILNGYDGTVAALDEGSQEEFLEHVAAKALIGDRDLMHNIGKADEGYALIDPDQAGAPIHTFEDSLFDYIQLINSGTSFNISHQDFQDAMGKVFREVGEGRLEASLSKLEPFKEVIPAYANFEPDFVRDNFRSARDTSEGSEVIERSSV
jgi:hypothetical protein